MYSVGAAVGESASVFNDGLVLYRVILKVITGKPQCSRNMPDAHMIVRMCVFMCVYLCEDQSELF